MAPKASEEQHRRMRELSRDVEFISPAISKVEKPCKKGRGRHSRKSSSLPNSSADAQHPSPPHNKKQPDLPRFPDTRITNTHILFRSGPLSNWHIGTSSNKKSTFSGRRALEILIPRLDEAGIKHPSERVLSTRLLARHNFNCGEQFMMACKGWLFERNEKIEPLTERYSDEQTEGLCQKLMEKGTPTSGNSGSNGDSDTSLARFRSLNSNILAVLSTTSPKEQKALGRRTSNFKEDIWTPASTHVVISACIARAEIDAELHAIYSFAGNTIPQMGQSSRNDKHPTNTTNTDVETDATDIQNGNGAREGTGKTLRTFVEGSP